MPYRHHSPEPIFSIKNPGHGKHIYSHSKFHFIGILACSLLLLGDFITTSMALSAGTLATASGTVALSEGNPLMAPIVSNPAIFLLSKLLILGMVIGAAYILRHNGFMAYMPYVIVGGMYLFVVANNLNLLMSAL